MYIRGIIALAGTLYVWTGSYDLLNYFVLDDNWWKDLVMIGTLLCTLHHDACARARIPLHPPLFCDPLSVSLFSLDLLDASGSVSGSASVSTLDAVASASALISVCCLSRVPSLSYMQMC